MANFPQPGNLSITGFVNGQNVVTCPAECRLLQNTPIYNKNDWGSHNNVYNMDDIQGYYCAVNSGPPIPHTTLPEGYTTSYYYITSSNWSDGFATSGATEDEVYTNPKSDFLYNSFNMAPTCPNTLPPTNTPVHNLPTGDCEKPQSSLSWFRLNPNLFK